MQTDHYLFAKTDHEARIERARARRLVRRARRQARGSALPLADLARSLIDRVRPNRHLAALSELHETKGTTP